MEQLYRLCEGVIRYYLVTQLGPRELEEKIQDTFLTVVDAIKRGFLREPEHLSGFIRIEVDRQSGVYIEQARGEQAGIESRIQAGDQKQSPDQEAMLRTDMQGFVSHQDTVSPC